VFRASPGSNGKCSLSGLLSLTLRDATDLTCAHFESHHTHALWVHWISVLMKLDKDYMHTGYWTPAWYMSPLLTCVSVIPLDFIY
jgi:hypothetical protein